METIIKKALRKDERKNADFNDIYKGLPKGAFSVLVVATTGLKQAKQFGPYWQKFAEPVEVAIVDVDEEGNITNAWSRIANPKQKYGNAVSDFNGITTNILRAGELEEKEIKEGWRPSAVAEEALKRLKKRKNVIGYNTDFAMVALQVSAKESPYKVVENNHWKEDLTPADRLANTKLFDLLGVSREVFDGRLASFTRDNILDEVRTNNQDSYYDSVSSDTKRRMCMSAAELLNEDGTNLDVVGLDHTPEAGSDEVALLDSSQRALPKALSIAMLALLERELSPEQVLHSVEKPWRGKVLIDPENSNARTEAELATDNQMQALINAYKAARSGKPVKNLAADTLTC